MPGWKSRPASLRSTTRFKLAQKLYAPTYLIATCALQQGTGENTGYICAKTQASMGPSRAAQVLLRQ